MKTKSAAVLVACALWGASGCGPGLEPPEASSGAIPKGDATDHGGIPGIHDRPASPAGSGASAAGVGAAPSRAGAGGSTGHAGQGAGGAAGAGADAGTEDDAGE